MLLKRGLLFVLLTFAGARLAAEDTPLGGSVRTGRWTLGAGWTYFRLEDTRRSTDHGPDNTNLNGNYLGSLWGLDAKQRVLPAPFVEYRAISSFGLGVSYEQQRARTLDWSQNDPTLPPVGDGDVQVRGAQLYVFGRYPNHTRLTPYAAVGRARYWSTFFTLPGWNGGDPGKVLQVDNTWGWIGSVGSRFAVGGHAAVDVSYHRAQITDVVARAYQDIIHHPSNRYRQGAFPTTSNAFRLGIAYPF